MANERQQRRAARRALEARAKGFAKDIVARYGGEAAAIPHIAEMILIYGDLRYNQALDDLQRALTILKTGLSHDVSGFAIMKHLDEHCDEMRVLMRTARPLKAL